MAENILSFPMITFDYSFDGRPAPRQLNGRFFLAFHGGASNEQVVVTDRLGSMHGYYVLREEMGRVGRERVLKEFTLA